MPAEGVDLKDTRTGERIETVMEGQWLGARHRYLFKLICHIIRQLDVVIEQTRKPAQTDNISRGYTRQDMDDIRRI